MAELPDSGAIDRTTVPAGHSRVFGREETCRGRRAADAEAAPERRRGR